MGAVAEAVLQRFQDQVALHVRNGAADQRAGDSFGRERRVRDGRRGALLFEPCAIRRDEEWAAGMTNPADARFLRWRSKKGKDQMVWFEIGRASCRERV